MHGFLVEDRVLKVDRLVRIGESDQALVSFPGADIAVVRMGRWLSVRGRKLEEGDEVAIFLGDKLDCKLNKECFVVLILN